VIFDYLTLTLKIYFHLGCSFEGEKTLKELGYDYYVDGSSKSFKGPKQYLADELSACLDPFSG
jgi:hypothetical protein